MKDWEALTAYCIMRYGGFMMATRTTSFRLPEHTKRQMEDLAQKLGMTQTQTLIVALDRLHQQELKGGKEPRPLAAKRKPTTEK
jgi:hypothetical protein